MKILTLNTWQESGPWEKRWEVTLEGMKVYQPDVIGFQETFNGSWMKEIQKRSGYPYLVYADDRCGQSMLSKHPVKRWDCLTMKTQAASEEYLRFVLFAELDVAGSVLSVFNTHLSWKTHESEARGAQVGELIDYVDENAGVGEAVAMGDFNAPPETSEVRKMMTIGKFNDTWAVKNPKDIGLTWDNRNPYAAGGTVMPDRRIDYIFVRNETNLLAHIERVELVFTEPNAEGIYATDHFGVLTTFRAKGD